mgnify:CR=1 FL=1
MRCYLSYFKLRFITNLQYRSAALAGVTTQIFFGLIFIMVYMAFYESGNANLPMELPQLITYLWLNQSLLSLINLFYKDKELFLLVTKGNLAYELTRPKDLYFMWYFKIIGQRLAMVLLRIIPFSIFLLFLPAPYRISLPASIPHFILFLLTLFIGTLLMTAIITLYPIITMKTLNEKGIVGLTCAIADLFSGLTVPIPFFPKFLQTISKYLPFQYVSDLPFRIYVGNIELMEGIYGLVLQLIWTILLIAIGYSLMHNSLKKVVVQGG